MKLKHSSIHILLPLLIGGFLYVAFRSRTLRLFDWFDYLRANEIISKIRQISIPIKGHLPPWIYYSLPDALWAYSFSSSFLLLWNSRTNKGKHWLVVPIISSCGVEIGQGLKLFPGTYDSIDIAFYISAILLSTTILKSKKKTNELL